LDVAIILILDVIRRLNIKIIESNIIPGINHNKCNKFGGGGIFDLKNGTDVFVMFEEFVRLECLKRGLTSFELFSVISDSFNGYIVV